ncbi:hypothetical protein BDM02DRAFT_3262038 [Thelephora ganbajun]|uniref:Uncharacterized protein n=1 Tax=Thelephora ganbajun TaxID=370292 RepID=A0ACB6ZC69_THEGA|nr:hypothetical protein BDM02DRAFT_3262038 [Thelephora ganbajun]
MTGQRGIVRYMAPEQVKPREFDPKNSNAAKAADVYSFAMTSYEVLTGIQPHSGVTVEGKLVMDIGSNTRPPRPKDGATVSKAIWEMMESCWTPEPSLRLSIEEVYRKLRSSVAVKDGPTPKGDKLPKGRTPQDPQQINDAGEPPKGGTPQDPLRNGTEEPPKRDTPQGRGSFQWVTTRGTVARPGQIIDDVSSFKLHRFIHHPLGIMGLTTDASPVVTLRTRVLVGYRKELFDNLYIYQFKPARKSGYSHGPPGVPNIASIVHQLVDVANGLDYLHSYGVVHEDLKGPNILVDGSDHHSPTADSEIRPTVQSSRPAPQQLDRFVDAPGDENGLCPLEKEIYLYGNLFPISSVAMAVYISVLCGPYVHNKSNMKHDRGLPASPRCPKSRSNDGGGVGLTM